MRVRRSLHLTALLLIVLASVQVTPALADESVNVCSSYPNNVFTPSSAYGIATTGTCPNGFIGLENDGFSFKQGQGAIWQAVAPAGLSIVDATVPAGALEVVSIGGGNQWSGNFYWGGGAGPIQSGQTGASFGPLSSSYFGVLMACTRATCDGNLARIRVYNITLSVRETTGPYLAGPTGLWQANGWIRGRWPLTIWGDSPSGLCGIVASLDGQSLPGTSSLRDPSRWHQCASGPINEPIDTEGYAQGANSLFVGAWDAAGVTVNYTKSVYVDNQQPVVTLTGPSDAASTSGTQYVTATATAGPSGVHGITCSVDGGPAQFAPGTTRQVPVSGIGAHTVTCSAQNNALDPQGNRATSTPQTFVMKIGVPTVTAIGFTRLVDRLRCGRTRVRVTVPSRWVTVVFDHHKIRVRTKPRTRVLTVVKCHPRVVMRERTVWITVRRDGRLVRVRRRERVRIVLLPHVDSRAARLVGHGRAVTISGWLGTSSGVALGAQPVQILPGTCAT